MFRTGKTDADWRPFICQEIGFLATRSQVRGTVSVETEILISRSVSCVLHWAWSDPISKRLKKKFVAGS